MKKHEDKKNLTDDPFLSIVVLVGPNSKNIKKLTRSLFASKFKSFELLIVDNSGKLNLSQFTTHGERINLIQMPKNLGILGYNIGYANSKGKYVLTIDDDCQIEKETLGRIVDSLEGIGSNVGIINLNVVNPITNTNEWSHYIKEISPFIPAFAGGANVIKKELFSRIGYYDESFFCWIHEDDFAIRALDRGYKIFFLKDIKIYHHNKESYFRPKKYFLTFRNRAWLNIKHFSIIMFPILILRDLLYGLSLLDFKYFFHKMFYINLGYLTGYFLFFLVLPRRKQAKIATQVYFLKNFVLRLKERLELN